MPLVIADSSVLIHLARIGRLALLHDICARLTVPPAVWREVVEQGQGRAGARELEQARDAGWIEIAAPKDDALVRLLGRDLDDGESAVIALAVERQADLVLMDESEARRIADLYGLAKTGVIGILMRARRRGALDSLRAELDKLQEAGFRIAPDLYRQALAAFGEAPRAP